MTDLDSSKWLHDYISPDLIQLHSIKKVIYSGQTKFQSVDIIETGSFGVCLILDGKIQSSENDEFIYHEALVHPSLITHPHPKKVFIAGGGEGATLREVLTHNTVDKVIMVDIDQEVVDICYQFLPSFHQNSFNDPRVQLFFADARKYLEDVKEQFDVIILDLVDPIEGGPACRLYTQEFYQRVKERLNPNGIMAVQAGPTSITNWQNFRAIVNTLKKIFPIVSPYQAHVPAFVDVWGFVCTSLSLEPQKLTPEEIDHRLQTRVSKRLKFYDGLTHQSLFMLPKHLRHQLSITKRIVTDRKPIFTY